MWSVNNLDRAVAKWTDQKRVTHAWRVGSLESIVPRNPDNLKFLQPAQCAYADDLAVASSYFRGLMTPLLASIGIIGSIAKLGAVWH